MATQPYLTVGMPTFRDWDSVWFVLQSLRMYHNLSEVELLVVDQEPDSPVSRGMSAWMNAWLQHGNCGVRYVPYNSVIGTAAAKNRVFAEARGEVVLCMDSHVLLRPNTLDKLMAWFREHPHSQDLLTGPLLYDAQVDGPNCFADVWRGEMWGIWATAFQYADEQPVWLHPNPDSDKLAQVWSLEMHPQVLDNPHLPAEIPAAGYEKVLFDAGYRRLGDNDADQFDVPGMGMGMFACRKEAWLGFHPGFRGFGGEEMYIHEKYRQAGRRCLSLGFLKWLHKFSRVGEVKYPLRLWDKVRNYVLGMQELGLSLDPLFERFVQGNLFPQHEWDYLLADPVGRINPPTGRATASNRDNIPANIDGIFAAVQRLPRDLEKHMPKLADLASQVESVTDISGRRESFIALAQARPKSLVSYNSERYDKLYQGVAEMAGAVVQETPPTEVTSIEPTDLLFIDEWHSYTPLKQALTNLAPSCRRFIVIHDTEVYQSRGADGGQGMGEALREFIEEHGGQWFVASHTKEQHGLTVLSCDPADLPDTPIVAWSHGPGTELKKMLATLGVNPSPACDCNSKAKQMDAWGVKGCKQNRETIIGWMRDGQGRWGWKDKVAAAAKAVTSGLAFKLNPLDPFPGIIDEAIRLAEAKEQQPQVGEWEVVA